MIRITRKDYEYLMLLREFSYDMGKKLNLKEKQNLEYNIERLGYFMSNPEDYENIGLYRITSLLAVRLQFGTLRPEFIIRCANIESSKPIKIPVEIYYLPLKKSNYKVFKAFVNSLDLKYEAKAFAIRWFIFGCRYNGYKRYLSKEVRI